MAIAEAALAARFNRPGHPIIDHHTYALASDGDLMEGVVLRGGFPGRSSGPGQAHRALRRQPRVHRRQHGPGLYGRPGGPLCRVRLAHRRGGDRQRHRRPGQAIHNARAETERPSFIGCARTSVTAVPTNRTWPPPTASRWARKRCGWPRRTSAGHWSPRSTSPTRPWTIFSKALDRGDQLQDEWNARFRGVCRKTYPRLAAEFSRFIERRASRALGEGPAGIQRGRWAAGHAQRERRGAQRHCRGICPS